MRNPFARVAKSEAYRPSLRERLNATKAKAKAVLAVKAPRVKPAADVDRVALVNYATWLYFERQRLCAELYPHLGAKAGGFVRTLNAAERFFFPDGMDDRMSRAWRNVPPPSSRAVGVLDLVGVDWRSNLNDRTRETMDEGCAADNGKRSPLPYGWPVLDAALTTALGDMLRITAAINVLPASLDREHGDLPEYAGLDEAIGETLSTLINTRAEGLAGLQAKAKALLSECLMHRDIDFSEMAQSLANDLLQATNGTLTPRPDPILALIKEGRRLLALSDALHSKVEGDDEEASKASTAAVRFCDDVILKTVPRTAAGCIELARYACDFERSQGVPVSDTPLAVFDLTARCPAL